MSSLNIEYIFLKIYQFFTEGDKFHIGVPSGLKSTVIFLLSLVGVIFFGVIVYSVMRLKERNKLNHERREAALEAHRAVKVEQKNERWQEVIRHINSTNPADWRLAIIEADAMIDAAIEKAGFIGENLGERLKGASRDHFRTLDNAWEAHKLRNRIAHEGLSFDLAYRDAKRAVEQYESVLAEFGAL